MSGNVITRSDTVLVVTMVVVTMIILKVVGMILAHAKHTM